MSALDQIFFDEQNPPAVGLRVHTLNPQYDKKVAVIEEVIPPTCARVKYADGYEECVEFSDLHPVE
jgi:hypothetical protein